MAKYRCPDCVFITNKKDSLVGHRVEFCVNPPIKDRDCKFCGKGFTRRGLRVHMDQYVTKKHKPSGKHKNVSSKDHLAYLDQIKSEMYWFFPSKMCYITEYSWINFFFFLDKQTLQIIKRLKILFWKQCTTYNNRQIYIYRIRLFAKMDKKVKNL